MGLFSNSACRCRVFFSGGNLRLKTLWYRWCSFFRVKNVSRGKLFCLVFIFFLREKIAKICNLAIVVKYRRRIYNRSDAKRKALCLPQQFQKKASESSDRLLSANLTAGLWERIHRTSPETSPPHARKVCKLFCFLLLSSGDHFLDSAGGKL